MTQFRREQAQPGREPRGSVEWSRRAILSILTEVLPDQALSLTILGGYAVMLRFQDTWGLKLPTADGDFAVTPIQVNDQPNLTEALVSAGFEPRNPDRPGLWGRGRHERPGGRPYWDEQIDLLCPGALSGNKGRRRSVATLKGNHGVRAVGLADGIELASVDRSPIRITDLADPSQSVDAYVAGIPALICAKSHKIGERLHSLATRPDRVTAKDYGDLFLLMTNSSPQDVMARFDEFIADPQIGPSVQRGHEHFGVVLREPASVELWREATEQVMSTTEFSALLDRWREVF